MIRRYTGSRILSQSIVALLLFVSGCTSSRDEKGIVLLLMKTQDNPYFQALEAGVRDELEKDSSTIDLLVRAGTKEGDISTQRQVLQQAYFDYVAHRNRSQLQGILLTPAGSQSELIPEIRQLREHGVPVIVLDTRINDASLREARTDVSSFIGSDNEEGGRIAARYILANASGGDVLLLNGVDGQETARARRNGFVSTMQTARRAITERTANWRRDEARSTVAGLSAVGKRYSAIFAANDEMALGASEGLSQSRVAGSGILVGFDAIPEAREAVGLGTITATIAQDPHGMGVRGVETLREISAGKPVPKEQLIPVHLVTVDSVRGPK